MGKTAQQDKGQIRVADVTIAQLSRGLYRSTATAFKELVSNAFDADAKVVRIHTNCPEFDFISCVDDGSGMTLEQFLRYFSHEGIGSCNKRKENRDKTPIFHRPVIGKLGIGMLAVGQLCDSFEIESHYLDGGVGKAFRATIVLQDVTIPRVEETIRNDDVMTKDTQVGTWEYEVIDYDESRRGFRISSSDVRNTFTREMALSLSSKTREKLTFSLPQLHSAFYGRARKSIRDCKPYLECIWELSTLCPLPYYGAKDGYPVNLSAFDADDRESDEFRSAIRFIRTRQEELLKQDFRVVFDGIELRRHIQLPTESDTVPRLYHINFEGDVLDEALKFSGYVFAQIPKAIRPAELNGVQIRLRGVGIGGYDKTFLRYSEDIETIRSRWVSGEIFVDHGLESALNIDRDSFNEHDEHFKQLQSELHRKLAPLFNEIEAIAQSGRDTKRQRRQDEVTKHLQETIAERSAGRVELARRDMGTQVPVVTWNEEGTKITLNTASRPTKKKKADGIFGAIMAAYHVAQKTADCEEDREAAFYELLKEILGKML